MIDPGWSCSWFGAKGTFDDLTNANGADKGPAADRGVESSRSPKSESESHDLQKKHSGENLLLSLLVGLGGILEVAGVLNGNAVADLGDGAAALLENGLGHTHCCCCNGEIAGCGELCRVGESSGGGSEGIGEGEHRVGAKKSEGVGLYVRG